MKELNYIETEKKKNYILNLNKFIIVMQVIKEIEIIISFKINLMPVITKIIPRSFNIFYFTIS